MGDNIIFIATVVGGIGTLVGVLYRMYRLARSIEEKYEEMNELIKENTIHILKIAVLNEDLPITDRINAGERYMALGGNWFVKEKYLKLLDEYEKMNERSK